METYLHKWTNYIFGWQRRYFVLHNGLLYYCKEKGTAARGFLHLDIAQIATHPRNPRRFYIDSGLVSMHLRAYTAAEASEWVSAIQSLQAELKERKLPENSRRATLRQVGATQLDILHGKIEEMWSVHASMQAAIDLVPKALSQSTPGLERIIELSLNMKTLSGETIQILEYEENLLVNQPPAHLRRSARTKTAPLESVYRELDSEDDFEDAVSHISRSETGRQGLDRSHAESETPPQRKCLPILRNPVQKNNAWAAIKDFVGQEFRNTTVPICFYEPLTVLQRLSEDLTYHETILRAAEAENPQLRLAFVSCFALSCLHSTVYRAMKPFAPLLGETFELENGGFSLLAEQVSPSTSALHCAHAEFTYWGSLEVQTCFKGTYLQMSPRGQFHLVLHRTGDHFTWNKPLINVCNLGTDKMRLEPVGELIIQNNSNKDKAVIRLKSPENEVHGEVLDPEQSPHYAIKGAWDRQINITDLATNELLVGWALLPYSEAFKFNYFFSDFALQLNLNPEFYPGLPTTDSRHRYDQRALEHGQIDEAAAEMGRLEEKQRVHIVRQGNGSTGDFPRWFCSRSDEWVYTNEYWEQRGRDSQILLV